MRSSSSYGRLPREGFPQATTFCLSGLAMDTSMAGDPDLRNTRCPRDDNGNVAARRSITMPRPLVKNPYFMSGVYKAQDNIKKRHGGSFPKISRADQGTIQSTLVLLKNAEYSLKANGLFGRDKRLETVERLGAKLETLAQKYDITPDELRVLAELGLNQHD